MYGGIPHQGSFKIYIYIREHGKNNSIGAWVCEREPLTVLRNCSPGSGANHSKLQSPFLGTNHSKLQSQFFGETPLRTAVPFLGEKPVE